MGVNAYKSLMRNASTRKSPTVVVLFLTLPDSLNTAGQLRGDAIRASLWPPHALQGRRRLFEFAERLDRTVLAACLLDRNGRLLGSKR
jgi:hypothetical protein